MKVIYFVDYGRNIYDINGNFIGVIGVDYVIDQNKSDLFFRGEKIGKFINVKNKEEIEKFNNLLNKDEFVEQNSDLEVADLKKITKEENGIIKNYVVTAEGQIYDDNNFNLNFSEKRKALLMEWLEDPLMSSKISNMSPEELDRELINVIKKDYKEYYFESSNEVNKEDEKGRIASERASEVDGRVNGELGIIENGVDNVNKYSTVEQRNDGYVVVNPTVVTDNLKSTNVVSGDGVKENDVNEEKEEIQQRDFQNTQYYYIDSDKNVYDSNGNKLEGVIPEYLIVDEENNLWYQNQKVGVYGGTLDDLAQNINNNKEKSNVRTLKKDNNAGFGQIVVLALVLVCLGLFIAIIALSLFS